MKVRSVVLLGICLSLLTTACPSREDVRKRRAALTAESFWRGIVQVNEKSLQKLMIPGLFERFQKYGDVLCRTRNGLCGAPRVATELSRALSIALADAEGSTDIGIRCEVSADDKAEEGQQAKQTGGGGGIQSVPPLVGTCELTALDWQEDGDRQSGSSDWEMVVQATAHLVPVKTGPRTTWKVTSFEIALPGETFSFSPADIQRKKTPIGLNFSAASTPSSAPAPSP